MKKNTIKTLIFSCIFIFLYSCIFILPVQAAVFDEIINNVGQFNQGAQLPTGSGDILPIIINIINIVLTFLALLFIVMILYGGFIYITAAGSPEKAKKAIGIIRDSVIGVIIVVLSGVFVNFILIKIIEAVR